MPVTAGDVRGALARAGLGALGIASPQLSASWGPATMVGNRLRFAGPFTAPFAGVVTDEANAPAHLTELDCAAIVGAVVVLTLHPQAYTRLQQLYRAVLQPPPGQPVPAQPVPMYATVQVANARTQGPELVAFGHGRFTATTLPAGDLAFHDARGLYIDPLAVASVFARILTDARFVGANGSQWLAPNTGAVNDPTGVATLANMPGRTNRVIVQVVNPHGRPFGSEGGPIGDDVLVNAQPLTNGVLAIVPSGGTPTISVATPPPPPPNTPPPPPSPVRIGFTTGGVMGPGPLTVPAQTPPLPVDFVRITAVQLDFHLLGNRWAGLIGNVPGRDAAALGEPAPLVRDGSPVTFIADAVDCLAAADAMLGAPNVLGYVASPQFEPDFVVPALAPAAPAARVTPPLVARWWDTNNPPPPWTAAHAAALRAPGNVTAVWADATSHDVLVTLAAPTIPAGAYVRVHPRRVDTRYPLTEHATLVRGDGVGAFMPGGNLTLRLADPFGRASQQPPPNRPQAALLTLDLLVVTGDPAGNAPRPRIVGNVQVTITATGTAPALALPNANRFAIAPFRAVVGGPIQSVPRLPSPAAPPNAAAGLLAWARWLTGDGVPRQPPRYPTMARHTTVVATRTNAGAPWLGLLTGAHLAPSSLAAAHDLGNPMGVMNDPSRPSTWSRGPDVHAPGVQVGAALGFDLACVALRLTKGWLNLDPNTSRLIDLDSTAAGGNQKVWAAAPPPNPAATTVGAVLETVAAGADDPEFAALYDDPFQVQARIMELWSEAQDVAGNPPTTPLPAAFNREVQRDAWAACFGRRDAQWALRRAIAQARDLVYIETPHLAPITPGPTDDTAFDVVAALRNRLNAADGRALRVVIVVPRELEYPPGYAGFAAQAYDLRRTGLASLVDAFPDRVVAVSPLGSAGRPLMLRSTVVIVDDVWCLCGTSRLSRRGLTFDGGTDLVAFDRQLVDGACVSIRNFRRDLMARLLVRPSSRLVGPMGDPNTNSVFPDPALVALEQPRAAFSAVRDLVADGGRGIVERVWAGPDVGQTQIVRTPEDHAEPDGRRFDAAIGIIMAALAAKDA